MSKRDIFDLILYSVEAGETYWDYCDSSPCVNNGTCITRAADYDCVCSEEWTGNNCETGKWCCERGEVERRNGR